MNRHIETGGGFSGDSRQEFHRSVDTETPNKEFFEMAGTELSSFERAHPFGPERESKSDQEKDRKKASNILQSLRKHPFTRPLFLAAALLVGGGVMREAFRFGTGPEPEKEPVEQTALDDPGIQQAFEKLVFAELVESKSVLTEYEGRYGRDTWSPDEQNEYSDISTLEGKFEYLHKDEPNIIAAYRDPQKRIENFRALMNLMSHEFKHSRLAFNFLDQSVDDAVSVLPTLESEQAFEIFDTFQKDLMSVGGIKPTRELSERLRASLPADHPISKTIDTSGILSPVISGWLEPSAENMMFFNQNTGRLEIYHKAGGNIFLLDAFPANGGPPDGAAWERGMPAHIAVRTPDGEYRFSQLFEKKSASWKNSWVTDTAHLRWDKSHTEVEYQDTDGKWRRLTGEDAEFVVNGAAQKPFREKERSALYQAASQRSEDGSWIRPFPFSVEEALGPDGELRSTWDMNEFGPKAIQILNRTDEDGREVWKPMTIFFHSSPYDEAPDVFLDYSHGCIHVKPPDLEMAASYLMKNSVIRISSFEFHSKSVAQTEKPGVSDESAG